MPAQSAVTTVATFRILRTQEDALKTIPSRYTSRSHLVRHLLELYLAGKIPDALPVEANPSTKVA